jgi:hypothetical protein
LARRRASGRPTHRPRAGAGARFGAVRGDRLRAGAHAVDVGLGVRGIGGNRVLTAPTCDDAPADANSARASVRRPICARMYYYARPARPGRARESRARPYGLAHQLAHPNGEIWWVLVGFSPGARKAGANKKPSESLKFQGLTVVEVTGFEPAIMH